MDFHDVRRTAERVRAIPLQNVLAITGAEPDPCDRAKWRTDQGVISVTGSKFFNWHRGSGGGGAIDLVIHLEGLAFRAAVEWLAHRFPDVDLSQSDSVARPSRARRLTLPQRQPATLSIVTSYLVRERQLTPAVIEPLIEAGTIYADDRANAVFLLLGNEGRPVGAEIRGTTTRPFKGMASGSCKDLGYFSIAPPDAKSLVLCESAIDALSCSLLYPSSRCISTAGARPSPRWIDTLLNGQLQVYCAFDADPTGDDMARLMIARHPRVRRLRPPRKDWNDVLRART